MDDLLLDVDDEMFTALQKIAEAKETTVEDFVREIIIKAAEEYINKPPR